ncbi:uncharacterized protein LOC143487027 [Brachyhypopomus gauderio]|uniref:uncharacterized protein LOC143487027 n=1 Tax=Brachyhypopomus gauderio TaxID=698409 RepID=UPI0040438A5D
MDEELKSFLRQRKIAEECIQKLENEKIDASVIPLMADKDLATYFPKAGDRVSIVAFCRQTNRSVDPSTRKESILSRLRRRLSPSEESTDNPAKKKNNLWIGNKSAQKQKRRIEVGWMDFDENEQRYKQVKAIKGGGTRQLTVDKETTIEEMKDLALSLFFPSGVSKTEKNVACYTTEIQSSQIDINSTDTVNQLYEKSKVRLLRLYLCTKKRSEQDLQSTVDLTGSDEEQNDQRFDENLDLEVVIGAAEDDGVSLDDTVPWETPDDPPSKAEFKISQSQMPEDAVPEILQFEVNRPYLPEDLIPVVREHEVNQPQIPGDHVPAILELTMFQQPQTQAALNTTVMPPVHATAVSEVMMIQQMPNDFVPIGQEQQTPADAEPATATLIIRRGHCLLDMIHAFKNPAILHTKVFVKMRLLNGQFEEGEGIGVLRDCLTEFWTEFYERCTLGMDVKVPFIRHDYQFDEWQAIGRIFVVGWFQAGYFPVQLATPFLEEVLYGTATSSLKDAFLQYVPEHEREILLKALQDFESVEGDVLFDALEAHECHHVPTKESMLPLLSQMGHKALIQAPMYVIECWRPIVQEIANALPLDDLHVILKRKIPTGKAVKDLLIFPDEMNALETLAARYLKTYIGELDSHTLKLFLRFYTGSNLIGGPITVQFIETSDFQRRPQSHTCGCVLKLPVGYHNYPDLRSDFNSILKSSVWVMDII